MNAFLRIVSALLGLVILAETLVLWNATGRELFTAYPNAARAQMQAYDAAAAGLFLPEEDEAAPADASPASPPSPAAPPAGTSNEFYFGLLPSGADKHLASVASIGGPALAMVLAALLIRTRRKG